MKRLAAFGLLLLISSAGLSAAPTEPNDFQVQTIHGHLDLTAAEVYDRALDWTAKTFTDSKEVIELKDRDRGKIIGKGIVSVPVYSKYPSDVRFTMTLEAKDGRCRATFGDYEALTTFGAKAIDQEAAAAKVSSAIRSIDMDLETALQAPKAEAW